ncbi:MAG: hypothetical protein JXR76_30670 [Deltaproteobacteria bacterium]|nr:hypothetical protein [Deltaproteobacteria bacterium]
MYLNDCGMKYGGSVWASTFGGWLYLIMITFLTIRIFEHNERVHIELEDNGPGFSPAVARRIFQPFFSTKKKGAGTEPGLSICYSIVTSEHHGTLRAKNAPGGGARFIIEFP